MLYGLFDLSLLGYILVTLGLTHITIIGVTVFLHRCQSHRALDLHPAVSHFLRFWLWLTTGMVTREWVAIHRKHHARVETPEDPHSPRVHGIRKVLLEGSELYRAEAANAETVRKFGHGTPDDWLERKVYAPHSAAGIGLLFIIDLVLFGIPGITIWAVQMLWIPVLAAGVINGVGHYWGYRNFETTDTSTNIVPWGILIGGEELHNNHHSYASSARLSNKWWEFDIGWLYIRVLESLGLARVKKVAPTPEFVPGKVGVDLDTLKAVITNRLQVRARYAKIVVGRVYKEEMQRLEGPCRNALKRARSALVRDESLLSSEARQRLEAALTSSQTLETVYRYRQRLQAIWQERTASQERLVQLLQEWCRQAEATGIRALQDFARSLPEYSMRPA